MLATDPGAEPLREPEIRFDMFGERRRDVRSGPGRESGEQYELVVGVSDHHCKTARALLLRRGQIGTVVMTYDGAVFDVEFAIRADKLMRLRETPKYAAA